jgi:hypothetical protein
MYVCTHAHTNKQKSNGTKLVSPELESLVAIYIYIRH